MPSTSVSSARRLHHRGAARGNENAAQESQKQAKAMSVIGTKVRLARKPVCCKGVCIVAMANEPWAGEFVCADCGKHRAWMSHKLARFIEETQRRFGAPEVITIGTAEERRDLNNRDYTLPEGVRIEIGNPAFPPRFSWRSAAAPLGGDEVAWRRFFATGKSHARG